MTNLYFYPTWNNGNKLKTSSNLGQSSRKDFSLNVKFGPRKSIYLVKTWEGKRNKWKIELLLGHESK